MSRLQFIHFDGATNNISRQDAVNYIKRLTNVSIREDMRFEESLIGEPIAVTYLDENNKVQVILGIGTKGEKNENILEPYHIIDSAFFQEEIESLSGYTSTLKEELEEEISRAILSEQTIQNELDNAEIGAGLNANGTYSVNVLAHYINHVSSLKDADNKLDEELYRVENARKNITGQDTDTYVPNQSFVGRKIDYITSATSLNDADIKLDEGIQNLNAETVKNIKVNNVNGTFEDNIASVVIDASNINIGEYEDYSGKAVKPHPIHDDYTVLDAIKQVDLNFIDFVEKEKLERKGIHIVKVTNGLEPNIREAYDLVDLSGNTMPNSERILIYKDSSLYRVYLGHVDDRLEDYTSPVITPGTGDTALCLIYITATGTYQLVTINIENFLQENEFEDGLQINDHKVSVLIDEESENFLTVSPDGVKLSGVQTAIITAKQDVQNIIVNFSGATLDEIDRLDSRINSEIERAVESESNITETVNTLSSNTISEITRLDNRINTETNRAILAENSISGTVNTFSAATYNEIWQANQNIIAEYTRALNAENSISGSVADLNDTMADFSSSTIFEIGILNNKINTEGTRATTAEQFISGSVFNLSASTLIEIDRAITAENLISGSVNSVQNELNTTQEGAGLNDNGTYKRHNTSEDFANYINSATSLDNADVILDRELKRVENSLSTTIDNLDTLSGNVKSLSASTVTNFTNLNNELNTTQEGAGLNTDGTYKPHNTSPSDLANYINTATSLNEADFILDRELKRVENSLSGSSGDLTVLSGKVIELSAATVEEIARVNAFSAATISEIGRLDNKIDSESNRATAAENSISGSVYTLSGNVISLSSNTVSEIGRLDNTIYDFSAATHSLIKSNKVASNDKTLTVNTTEIGTDVSVNIDNVTLSKNANGVLSTHLNIKKLATPSSTNVKEEYILADANDIQHGESIKIYKDSSLQKVELITISGKEYLRFTYILADGTTSEVDIDVSEFLSESEFKDGLRVSDSKVYVRIDAESESYLTVSSNGVKLSGIEQAISGAVYNEETRAKSAEQFISGSVNTLRNDTVASAHTLSDNISTLRHDTELSAHTLSDSISSLRTDATFSATTLYNALQNEATRATTAENNLQSGITNEINRATSAETLLNNAINAETLARTTADSTLEANINTLSGITQGLRTDLTNESTTARANEERISNSLSALSSATESYFNNLPSQIDEQISNKMSNTLVATSSSSATTNDSLLRYWNDGTNNHYYASNNTKDMYYSGQTLEDVITADKAKIAELEQQLSALTVDIGTIVYNKVKSILKYIDENDDIVLTPNDTEQTIEVGFATDAKMDCDIYSDYTTD